MDQLPSPPPMTCILKLDTQTAGWQKSMITVLQSIRDVTYTIDAHRGLAHVTGEISPDIILAILAKTDKHAELIRVDYGNNNYRVPMHNYNYPQQQQPYPYPYPYQYPRPYPYQQQQQPYWYPQYPNPPMQHYTQTGDPYYYPSSSNYYSGRDGQYYPYSSPYYTPEAQFFPQPPPQPLNFSEGDPQCRIM